MNIKEEILINQYAQNLIEINELIKLFISLNNKRIFLKELLFYFIIQSKPKSEDIEYAITISKLKSTYTPCVLLKKGIEKNNLEKIIQLPDNELEKIFILFLNLFKISYNRNYLIERNNSNKWWYWDLSNEENINKIILSN